MGKKDINNGFIISFLISKRLRLIRHAFFLIAFFFLLYLGEFFNEFPINIAYCVIFLIYGIFIGMFYFNMYVLIPVFLFKNRYILYSISLILLVLLGINAIEWFFDNYFNEHRLVAISSLRKSKVNYSIILICASFISLSTTIKLLQYWIRDKERIVELKSLTYSMELNALRNQVSPHFLFNMLNNVKALIRTQPELATTVLVKLSEFLRYQLYESNRDRVLLSREIEFILNFLNLEKIRKDNLLIDFNCKISDNRIKSLFIPSGLFTVFVENAIKYSFDIHEQISYIKIDISISNDKLIFKCVNSKSKDFLLYKNKSGGLGLCNIKRRLELLYSGKQDLEIISKENQFIVNLTIPL
ncbi:sensor histidine kinase [Myroides sp. LJL110]